MAVGLTAVFRDRLEEIIFMKETIKKALARNCSAKAFCVYGIFKRLEKAIDTYI